MWDPSGRFCEYLCHTPVDASSVTGDMNRKDAKELDDLTQRRDRVIEVAQTHPEQAATEARKLAERICKSVYRRERSDKLDSKSMLGPMIKKLTNAELLPLDIGTVLGTIQHIGNIGSHDQDSEGHSLSVESVSPSIAALVTVVNWYCKKYLGKMPRAPVDAERNVLARQTYSQQFKTFLH